MQIPRYLTGYESTYVTAPRAAALEWFRDAKFGLFLHYGLYSLMEGLHNGVDVKRSGAEWIRWAAPVPPSEYNKLAETFTAEAFDADAICDLAVEAGMRYVNLTTRHHDGFCLWDTATSAFKSTNSPARRDLIDELVGACDSHGLGCFLYYSHGRDWWHPHSPDNGRASCRPDTPEDLAHFKTGDAYDLNIYLDFVEAQVIELCTTYSPIAGIWLDGIGEFYNMENGVEASRCFELYDKIRATQPQILVSYKDGLTGTEDFFAPERKLRHGKGHAPADPDKYYEICTTLQPTSWGYRAADDGKHQDADWVMAQLDMASAIPANVLLNTGPRGDGSIPEEDAVTLREVGRRLRASGAA